MSRTEQCILARAGEARQSESWLPYARSSALSCCPCWPTRSVVFYALVSRTLRAVVYLLILLLILFVGVRYFHNLESARPPDFVPFDLGGKLAAAGQIAHLYDTSAYQPYIDQFVREGGRLTKFGNYYFIRPAFEALFYIPFSWFSYPTASALAVLMNFLLLCLLVWKLPEWYPVRHGLKPVVRGCLLLFFPFHWSIMVGQDTLLLTLIVAYAYRLAFQGRQGVAGFLLGLGAYKPHLIWLLPLVMIAEKRWRMLAAFLATCTALAGVCLAAVGPAGIRAWIKLVQDPSSDIRPDIMGNIRALALHFGSWAGIAAVGFVVVCLCLVLRYGEGYNRVAAALFAAILLSPHAYWQDYSVTAMTGLTAPHIAAQFLLLLPWPYFYGPLDELPIVFLSLGWLGVMAVKATVGAWRLRSRCPVGPGSKGLGAHAPVL